MERRNRHRPVTGARVVAPLALLALASCIDAQDVESACREAVTPIAADVSAIRAHQEGATAAPAPDPRPQPTPRPGGLPPGGEVLNLVGRDLHLVSTAGQVLVRPLPKLGGGPVTDLGGPGWASTRGFGDDGATTPSPVPVLIEDPSGGGAAGTVHLVTLDEQTPPHWMTGVYDVVAYEGNSGSQTVLRTTSAHHSQDPSARFRVVNATDVTVVVTAADSAGQTIPIGGNGTLTIASRAGADTDLPGGTTVRWTITGGGEQRSFDYAVPGGAAPANLYVSLGSSAFVMHSHVGEAWAAGGNVQPGELRPRLTALAPAPGQ